MSKVFYYILPFYLISFVLSTAGEEIFGALLFLIFLTQLILDIRTKSLKDSARKLKIGPDSILLFFAGWALISAYVATSDPDVVKLTLERLRWVLMLYSLSYLLKTYFKGTYHRHLQLLFAAVILAGSYGLFQMFTGIDLVRGPHNHISPIGNYFRATGFHSISLTYAYCLGMCGVFAFANLLIPSQQNAKIKIYYFISFILAIAGVVASFTRGSWVALIAAIIIMTTALNIRKALIAVVICFLVGLTSLFIPSLQQRVTSIIDTSDTGANAQRKAIWKSNWEMFKDHPVFGMGYNQSKYHLKEYMEKIGHPEQYDGFPFHAHNDLLQTLSGTGLPGAIAWLLLCSYFLILSYQLFRKESDKNIKPLLLGCFGALIYMHIGGITQVNFYDNEVTHIVIFIWSLLLTIQFQKRISKHSY